MYKHPIGVSRNDREIYVNLIQSPAGQYLNRQPHLLSMIKMVLEPMDLAGREVLVEQDMGRIIGNTNVVMTTEGDAVFYAQPFRKATLCRFVKRRTLSPSSTLTIILQRDDGDGYEVVDTWVGPFSPPFPSDDNATLASKEYWRTHALVADSEHIQLKTVTKVCPY